ncbi:DUF5686 family protein [Flavobacteriaceae bacterium M23B6Z8]
MRSTLLAFLLLFSVVVCAQNSIYGIVEDAQTGEPLPFVSIKKNGVELLLTNADGRFEINNLEATTFLDVSYVGYLPASTKIILSQKFYRIALERNKLYTESRYSELENEAAEIIQRAISLKKQNNPLKALQSFRFKAYQKLLITANPDSLTAYADSIFIKRKGKLRLKGIDSSNLRWKKQLEKSHLYLSEKVSEIRYSQPGRLQEYILASRMGGFKKPVKELLTLELQSFSLYANTFSVMGNEYKAPLSKNAKKNYGFRLLDSVTISGRDTYLIHFYPLKNKASTAIQGVLYMDQQSLAIQKGIIQVRSGISVNAIQEFKYFPDKNIWLPAIKEISVAKGINADKISLFGNTIDLDTDEKSMKDSIGIGTKEQKISDFAKLVSKEVYFDFDLNTRSDFQGRRINVVLDDQIANRDEDFWKTFRKDSITKRDLATYNFLDSISQAKKVENTVGLIRKLTQGYFGTRYLDFDLRYLIKYNNFEGFKPGIGTVTNDNFSKTLRLSAYGLYGFKDRDFKYGLGAETRLDRFSDTWLGFMFTDDLTETGSEAFITDGRAFYVFEPRLFNITLFHKNKTLSPYFKTDITSTLTAKIQLNKSDIAPTFNYIFLNRGELFDNYKTATLQMALHWSPANKFLVSDAGKETFRKRYPQFTVQLTKGFQDFLDADFSFTKLNFRGIYALNTLSGTSTTFLMRGGFAWGDLPITELYHVSPNNPDNTSILRRFSVADSNSFETMFFNEFFSDKYLSLQLRHSLRRFNISDKFRPELVLVSRFAIGDASSQDKHLNFNFNTLEKGYYESGIELNYLFKGFGLSSFYRYGPYQLEGFDQNFSLKFTFNFSLGF